MIHDLYDYNGVSAETRAALTGLCTEYVWRIDNGHAERVSELFTDDASWSGPWGTMRGREEMVKAWNERATRTVRTRHMLSNLRFVQPEPRVAYGQISLVLFLADGDAPMRPVPVMIAEHHDEYALGDDGVWRFRNRRVDVVAESE